MKEEWDELMAVCCLQVVKDCLIYQNSRGFFPEVEGKLISVVSNLWKKKYFKIAVNKWMIWNSNSALITVNICHNNI